MGRRQPWKIFEGKAFQAEGMVNVRLLVVSKSSVFRKPKSLVIKKTVE